MTMVVISDTDNSLTRSQLREKLAKDVAEFLAKGGKIEDCTKNYGLKNDRGNKAGGDMIYLTPSHSVNTALASLQ